MSEEIRLITKAQVVERLNISERSLEKMVAANKFPPPLRFGKKVQWADSVVENWLQRAVQGQLEWEPPKRHRRTP